MDDHGTGQSDEFLDTNVVGASPAFADLRRKIADLNRWHRFAPGRIRCVLVTGETGVGKFELARLVVLHDQWIRAQGDLPRPVVLSRAAAPLTRVLLTALTDTLAESELFGYVRGAYTGASSSGSPGVFGDTKVKNVLLDEIGDCSLALQAKLLQVIEDATFRPVGARPSDVKKTEARIFLATRRDLRELVDRGLFRDDLYFRIAPFRLHVPALRERANDIPTFITQVIEERTAGLNLPVLGLPEGVAVSDEDIAFALKYPWPGNLRQLTDAVQSWLLCGCRVPFRDVVAELESVGSTAGAGVAAVVRDRLTAVLSARHAPYAKLGDLLEDIATDARTAIYNAYHEETIQKHDWEKVFTAQALPNIRSAISGFGPGRDRNRSTE